jgi:osmotically inducible protein OsmC
VPRIVREADVVWEGNVARGSGRITAASSGSFTELPYSLPSRIGDPEGKTSPEELLAAAHGACFAMSLASELVGAGMPPTRVDVHCAVIMDEVEGRGHLVVESAISARATVPEADQEGFGRAVTAADEGCPFSTLIKASAKVTIDARLEES